MGTTYIYPPVSVTTLPPIGGATAANQLAEIAELQTLNAELATFSNENMTNLLSLIGNQTNGTQKTKITDGTDDAQVVQLGVQLQNTDKGLVTNTVIHGLNSGGGGSYVDVKVTPSGALVTETTVTSSALPTGAATSANQATELTRLGDLTETAPATDTASSGLNGRLQRIAQRLTSLIALFPISLGSKADASSFAVTWATEDKAYIGSLIETAPASDTASSGLNGRLQRIAQRLTSLIALLPASLGQKTMANSLAVVIASDQSTLTVNQANRAGTITNAQITVGTTAVRATVSGSAPNAARKKLIIKPNKNNTGVIVLGSSSVTTANGLEIIGPDRLEFLLDASDYYLRSDTAAQIVEIIEVV